jgi:hypothetical protein
MFVSASTYILLGNMLSFRFISVFETLLFNLQRLTFRWERRMFENLISNAASMLLLFFGISIVSIFLTGYLWSRERTKILPE